MLGFAFTVLMIVLGLPARPGCSRRGWRGRDARAWKVALALAYRQMTVLFKNPALFLPPMLFPLMSFLAFAGGLSGLSQVPGFQYEGGYTPFVFVFVLLQSAAFSGVFMGFNVARDFETGFARRLMIAVSHRTGLILGYALSALLRWVTVAIVLTASR